MKLAYKIMAVCFSSFCLLPSPASAQSTIDFYGGSRAGTYQNISQDMKHLLAEKGITMEVHATDGSIDNIKKVAASKKAAIGIVQADVLGFMRRSDNPDTRRFADRIRMVMPLYEEEVHILASKDIKRFSDLKGKKVVIGEQGSGNMLTSVNLLAISDITVGETIRLSPPMGVRAVLEGSADAVIYVGGKPVKLFKNIESLETADGNKFSSLLENVHFIPVASPEILAEYASAKITPEDYRFVDKVIPTIAVQAVLVTGNYEQKGEQSICRLVGSASSYIRSNLNQLRKTGHPKWRTIDPSLPIALWEKDPCSWPDQARRNNPKKGS